MRIPSKMSLFNNLMLPLSIQKFMEMTHHLLLFLLLHNQLKKLPKILMLVEILPLGLLQAMMKFLPLELIQ